MAERSPICNKIVLRNARSGDEFVGLKIRGEEKTVTFPMGYGLGEETIVFESLNRVQRKQILNLVGTINACKKLKEGERISEFNGKRCEKQFPLRAILFIIEDFLNHGTYYTEKEILYARAKSGKIAWNRTIKNIQPTASENGIAYLDFIIRKNHIQENQLITELHKYCVYKCFELLGFLYTSFLPEKGQVQESDVAKNKKPFLAFLQEKIDNTHLEQNLELFSAMYEFFDKFSTDGELATATYGTRSFQTVWKSLVKKAFSTISQSQKEKYFYPASRWTFSDGTGKRNAPLRPDTIMILDGRCFILDAKYYSYDMLRKIEGGEENEQESVLIHGSIPGSDSIQKQITYAQYIDKDIASRNADNRKRYRYDHKDIFNIFILPADNGDTPIKYIGSATSDWHDGSKNYHTIHALTIDTKWMMENAGKNTIDFRNELFELLIQREYKNS